MPVTAAAAARLSNGRGGVGVFVLASVRSPRRRRRSNDDISCSSAFFPASHRQTPLTVAASLLFPSSSSRPAATSVTRVRGSCHQLSCLAPQETTAAADPLPSDPLRQAAGSLDVRVGRVLRAWRHPEADSLYVEEVDVGEAEPRTICSGLVGHVPLEALESARVVVLANLKPRNMRGVKSNGMLLAASDAARQTVELLAAPEGAPPGDRVWFGAQGGEQPEPATPNQVQKKKIWESVQPHLKTDENFVAMLGEHPMQTSAGVVVCRSLKNAIIS